MSETILTKTILASRIPTIIANKTLGYMGKYLNLINTVNMDYSNDVAQFGQTVTVTKRGAVTAQPKVENESVTKQAPSETNVSVTLDQHYHVTVGASDLSRAFAKAGIGDVITPEVLKKVQEILGGYAEDSAIVLAEKVEDTLASLYVNAGDTYNAGSAVELADLRAVRRMMVTAKVPKNAPINAYLDEYAVEDLPLTDAATLGTNRPIIEGSIARLAGLDIFETQCVKTSGSPSTYHDLIYTKDAIALAVRPLPNDGEIFGGVKQFAAVAPSTGLSIRVTTSYNPDYLFPQFTMDLLWGVKVIRSEHLIDMYHTNS